MGMNMTKNDIIQMLKQGQSPQQIVMNYLQNNNTNSPVLSNLLALVQSGDMKSAEQVARNMAAQNGVDLDKALAEFQSFLGAKGKRQG